MQRHQQASESEGGRAPKKLCANGKGSQEGGANPWHGENWVMAIPECRQS